MSKEAKRNSLYFQIPNSIIQYACSPCYIENHNSMVLPVYLYSAVNFQYHNDCKVDTNLSLIASTFDHTNNKLWKDVRDALKLLHSGYNTTIFTPELKIKSKSIDIPQSIEYKMHIDNVSKTDRIEYYFLNRYASFASGESMNGYTTFYHDEYNYLIDSISYANDNSPKDINLVQLITVYSYFKMQIQYFNSLSKNSAFDYSFRQTLDTISTNLCMARRVLMRYINFLYDIGMIDFDKQDSGSRNSRVYTLSMRWKK